VVVRLPCSSAAEAESLARDRLMPALVARRPLTLNFSGLDVATQSFLHALLFEPVRLAWALRVPIFVDQAAPSVRQGLDFLESYALASK
jgi:hypothetical protein